MNNTLKPSIISLTLILVSAAAWGAEPQQLARTAVDRSARMPVEFLLGSYEVVGRRPDSQQIYTGTMTISLGDPESSSLSITRTISGTTTQGTGAVTSTTGDAVVVLRAEFDEEGGTKAATYLIETDLDNYARLTGYVYAKDGDTSLPGIEALFNDHYKDQ